MSERDSRGRPPLQADPPRPDDTASLSGPVNLVQLLEELARVEHEIEALEKYREQLREKLEGMGVADAG